MGQLVTYGVTKTASNTFELSFEVTQGTEVAYAYDKLTNINTITLTTGLGRDTKLTKTYTSKNGVLNLSFRQENSGALKRTLGGDPDIIIDDGDGGGL